MLTIQPNSKQKQRRCVETCPKEGFLKVGHQCIEILEATSEILKLGRLESFGSIFTKILSSLNVCWGEIVAIALLAFLFSSLVVVLIRFAARLVVLTVIFGAIVAFLIFSCWLAYKAASCQDHFKTAYGVGTFVVILWTMVLTVIIFGMRKKIPLVIGIFKEASKALADIPSILAVLILVNH